MSIRLCLVGKVITRHQHCIHASKTITWTARFRLERAAPASPAHRGLIAHMLETPPCWISNGWLCELPP